MKIARIFGISMITIFIGLFWFFSGASEPKTPEEIKKEKQEQIVNEKEQKRAKKIDWALTTLKEKIKDRMNDPDSFEMITRIYDEKDKGDVVKLIIEYSGKNAFGGRVKNVAFGRVSLSTGKVWFAKSAD